MRLFFIAFLLLIQQTGQLPDGKSKATHSNNDKSNSTQVVSSSKASGGTKEECSAHNPKDAEHYDPRNDRLYRWYMGSTVAGVVGGFIGIIVLLVQNLLLRRQVNYLAGIERPWLMVHQLHRGSQQIRKSDDTEERAETYLTASFSFENRGKTPAIINKVEGGCGLVTQLAHEAIFYGEPNRGQVEPILAPTEHSATVTFIFDHVLTDEEIEGMKGGISHHFLAYGRIEYSDSFDKRHISTFCYIFDMQRMKFNYLCHNTGHNKYT